MPFPDLARNAARALTAALVAAAFGCAGLQEPAPVTSTTPAAKAPKPQPAGALRFNLVGYPDAYKAGHMDACANPQRRNDARFKADADYSMGWTDGRLACRAR